MIKIRASRERADAREKLSFLKKLSFLNCRLRSRRRADCVTPIINCSREWRAASCPPCVFM